jgi:hypothetical protein
MNEKEIRERIERFLMRAAQTVVVPAAVGLGVSLSGCDQHALQAGGRDAGTIEAKPDAALPDAALRDAALRDAAPNPDLPFIALPYLMVLDRPDSGPDASPEVGSEAGSPPDRLDAADEMPWPPLVYIYLLNR